MGVLVAQTHPSVPAFPETTIGSACTSSFSRIARRLLTLRPAHSRGHQIVTVIRRLQTLRHLHACSGRFRLERSPGGACTRWKRAALSRRTWFADIRARFVRNLSDCSGGRPSRCEIFGGQTAPAPGEELGVIAE